MKKLICLLLILALSSVFPLFANAADEGNVVNINDYPNLDAAIAAAGVGGTVVYPEGIYYGFNISAASNAAGVEIHFEEGAVINGTVRIENCDSVTISGPLTANGQIGIFNVTNFTMEQATVQGNYYFELWGDQSVQPGQIWNQRDMNIRIGTIKSVGGIIYIRNSKDLIIDKIISDNAAATAIWMNDLRDFYVGTIDVRYPNRGNSSDVNNYRAIIMERVRDGVISEYYLCNDTNVVRTLEVGGGFDEGSISDNVVFDQMYYYSEQSILSHDIVTQGGPYAPTNLYINLWYYCAGVENPEWTLFASTPLPPATPAFEATDTSISQTGDLTGNVTIDTTIASLKGFKRNLLAAAFVYDENGACIASGSYQQVLDQSEASLSFDLEIPDGKVGKTAKVFIWDADDEMKPLVPTITFDASTDEN